MIHPRMDKELLAGNYLVFYDRNWGEIGERLEALAANIEVATGITVKDQDDWRHASIATKMSWASRRETSRIEDIAYCLLGLFCANMPLLYGEGMKAFFRLQSEIIKMSDDESIFAWEFEDDQYSESGMFAKFPRNFWRSGDITYDVWFYAHPRPPYTLTNRGLEFHVPHPSECN